MNCRICEKETGKSFEGNMLNKHMISYFYCNNCGFLQTEEAYWLKEAYKDPINMTDTGIIQRNIWLSKVTSSLIFFLFDKSAKFLDFAGGYGIFTRLMRDRSFDFYWHDPYTENIFAKGFEYQKKEEIDLLTTFESFEHFVEPMKEIQKITEISSNILFTTELLPNPIPEPDKWWYYGLEHGQHIGFYSIKTLNYIAKKFNLRFYTNGKDVHLFTKKKINKVLFFCLLKFHKVFAVLSQKGMSSKTIEDMNSLKKE
jgi:Methyltransferase domain